MLRRPLLAISCLALLAGCTKSTDSAPAFDQAPLLANAADHIIIPAYQQLAIAADSQQKTIDRFVAHPTDTTLHAARSAFRVAFLSSQYISCFDFGPANLGNAVMVGKEVGTFPANAAQIEDRIARNELLPTGSIYADRRGFAALDYLLYGTDSTAALARFADASRKSYLQAAAADIAAKVHTVATAWPAYRDAFVAATGTDAGLSVSNYYNAFVYGFEVAKNYKVAIPAGKMAGQTGPAPETAEALYSGLSREALAADLALFKRIYTGDVGTQSGIGFDEYLSNVAGGPALVTSTSSQYAATLAAYQALPAQPVSTLAQQQSAELSRFSDEMQKLTRFYKSDMSSLLGIAITFSSGDGD